MLAAAARDADAVARAAGDVQGRGRRCRTPTQRVAAAVPPRLASGLKAAAEAARIERALREGPGRALGRRALPPALEPRRRWRRCAPRSRRIAPIPPGGRRRSRRRPPSRRGRCAKCRGSWSRAFDRSGGSGRVGRLATMADDIPTLRRILRSARTIAVVGLSAEWHRPSFFAAKYMQEHGYRIVPVNPALSRDPRRALPCEPGDDRGAGRHRRRVPPHRRRPADRPRRRSPSAPSASGSRSA